MSYNMTAKKQQMKLTEELVRKTHFCKSEIENLLAMFKNLCGNSAQLKLDRTKFRDVLHNTFNMTDDVLMDRVFRAFDRDNDSYISMEEWVLGMSTFLFGTLEEQIDYAFKVYDLNNDGYISREEMFHLLKTSLTKQPTEEDPDEGTKDLVEITLKKMDHDHDNRVSMADFKRAVELEPLLLEAFGPCLPEAACNKAFKAAFSKKN